MPRPSHSSRFYHPHNILAAITVKNCQEFKGKEEVKERKYLGDSRFSLSTKFRFWDIKTNVLELRSLLKI